MAENVFGKTITDLRRYAVKEPLSVRKANAEVDAINALSHAIRTPEQIVPVRGGGGTAGPQIDTLRYATVIAVEVPSSRAVKVQFKRWSNAEPPVLEDDGVPEFVECWPDLQARDFLTFVGTSDIFPVHLIQGGWVISWKLNWVLDEPDPALPWGQCLP